MNRYTKALYLLFFIMSSYVHIQPMDEKMRATSALWNMLDNNNPLPTLIEKIIKKGADVNDTSDKGISILMFACSKPKVSVEIIQNLLDHGALPTLVCKDGANALHYACIEGHANALSILFKQGMDPNMETNNGDRLTPLQLAVQSEHTHIMEMLLNHEKIDINKQDAHGNTALNYACRTTELKNKKIRPPKKILQLLLLHKPNLEIYNEEGTTALCGTICENFLEGTEMLLKQGANAHILSHDKQTLLHAACFNPNKKIIEYLVSKQLDVNAKTVDGITPACFLAQAGKTEELKLLHEYGADLTTPDNAGVTLLMRAACFGHSGTAEYLFDKSNPEARDIYNNSILTYALFSKNLVNIKFFLNKYTSYAHAKEEGAAKAFLKRLFFEKNKQNKTFVDMVKKINNTNIISLVQKYTPKTNITKKKQSSTTSNNKKENTPNKALTQPIPNHSLTESINFADRYNNWFDKEWLQAKRTSIENKGLPAWKFEQSQRYHQIPAEIIKIILVFGSQEKRKNKSSESQDLCYKLEGIMQFKHPKSNPWHPGKQCQKGVYHGTVGSDNKVYHVGFNPLNDENITLFDFIPHRNVIFEENDKATNEIFAFWHPEQGIRHVLFRL